MAQLGGTHEIVSDVAAEAKRTTALAGGKWFAESWAQGIAAALNPLVMGSFAAVSAVVNQMEYNHVREKIAHFYTDEISAKLEKPKQIVGREDLDVLEKGDKKRDIRPNYVIQQELSRERWKRNVGIGASFLASLATFALISTIIPNAAVEKAASWTFEAAVPYIAKMAVSVLTYMAIKAPIANFVNHLIGNDRETAHDKIVAMAKAHKQGKSVSKQQIVDVFIAGNKDLQTHIEKNYGVFYEELPVIDRAEITKHLTEHLPIEAIQKNINAGITDASELAFTVQGDVSGVLPKPPEVSKKPTRLGALAHKLEVTGQKLPHWLKTDDKPIAEEMDNFKKIIHESLAKNEAAAPEEYDNEPSRKFTESVGRAPVDLSIGHADRLAQARHAQIMAPASNTIH